MSVSKNQSSDDEVWDVVVVGGGPAGMMAAATAASNGARVLLLEKNPQLGKKLSITGGGRCNVTNNKPNVREMLEQYKTDGKFLFSTFMQHGVTESIGWFLDRGVPFKEENEGRLFPQTESALTIRDTLAEELLRQRVTVRTEQSVVAIVYDKATKLFNIKLTAGQVTARACVLATGGSSRPETGSTGEGFGWLAGLGHTVVARDSALVPLALKTAWTKRLSGLTLPQVKISIWTDEKKRSVHSGRLLFTHFGVTGPLILNLSKEVKDYLAQGTVTLKLDVFPQYDAGALKQYLTTLLASNKKLYNALAQELPRQLVKEVLQELAIEGETPCHSVTKIDRTKLLLYLKSIPLPVAGLLGNDKAIVSSGGVVLEEVDFKTMQSKIVPRLFIVGDLLNINRPSGGYSLQLCWSTGYVAGQQASKT